MKQETFYSRNKVTIVMIPALIGLHWGWMAIQKNRMLVSEKEEIPVPLVTFGKYLWNRLQGLDTAKNDADMTPAPAATTPK